MSLNDSMKATAKDEEGRLQVTAGPFRTWGANDLPSLRGACMPIRDW
jgi:hypothetical protein